jgi:hypothetical protein
MAYDDDDRADRPVRTETHLPIILMVVSLFLWVGFQTYQEIGDLHTLSDLRSSQEQTVQEAAKLRRQLEALAGGTAQLAAAGDAGARAVADEMKRQGVTLAPPSK